ncbi:MAG: dockerin type I repeat-containing protein, partial [Clostridia bacterium]|nr:dockerin type I repeat-containing protein [Clostridia bacterium]
VNFKDTEDVNFVVDMLNAVADEANEIGVFDYELRNWSADNEDGIPKFAENPAYIIGDANLDNKVDSVDYLLVKRHCFKTYTLEGDALKAANINGDEKIDSTDYLLVKRICFGTYKA